MKNVFFMLKILHYTKKISGFKAFTLAEVLITLGIIGVVASMTIPSLIANQQKMQYVEGMKKAYSLWNQALIQMAADAGCAGDLSCFFDSNNIKTMGDKIVPYFKVIKNCDNSQSGCMASVTSLYYDGRNPDSDAYNTNLYYKFITADGMSFAINGVADSCIGTSGLLTKVCGDLIIDINGTVKPNSMGRDMFRFVIYSADGPSLYPYGGAKKGNWTPASNACSTIGNTDTYKSGDFCSGRIMIENWQMNY